MLGVLVTMMVPHVNSRVCGTVATCPSQFAGYSIADNCVMKPDGSHIQFGSEVTIQWASLHYTVQACWEHFELNIALIYKDKVSWFVKNTAYDHLSLLSHYQGTVTFQGVTQAIRGACTFEYARCPSPYLLRNQVLPAALKVPLDFFTSQVVNLPDARQLLLAQAMIKGVPILSAAYLRSADAYSVTYRQVEFSVNAHQKDMKVSPDGVYMQVPEQFQWEVRDHGAHVLSLSGKVDTPLIYGLGAGYVGGYSYTATLEGKLIDGRGYIEYIDRRPV